MARATDAARVWARTIIHQFDDGIDFGQSDVDEFFRLTRKDQKELAATSIEMFASIVDEVVSIGADFYVEFWIPLPERHQLPVVRQSVADLLALADFTGNLRGRSVPGFVLARQNLTALPITHEEYQTVVESSATFARPISSTLRLSRWTRDEPFDARLEFTSYASQPPLAESTFITL